MEVQFWHGLAHWVGDLDKLEGERPKEIMVYEVGRQKMWEDCTAFILTYSI